MRILYACNYIQNACRFLFRCTMIPKRTKRARCVPTSTYMLTRWSLLFAHSLPLLSFSRSNLYIYRKPKSCFRPMDRLRLHLRDTAVNCRSYSRVTTIICKGTSVLTMPTLMAFAKGVQQKWLREQHCLPQHHPSQPEASGPLGESWISIGILPSQETTTWVAALQVLIRTQKTLPFSPRISPLAILWRT